MGTSYTVKVVGSADEAAVGALVRQQLDLVDNRMSTYKSTSELSRFNRHRSTEPFPLSPETLAVFRLALEVSAATGGAFDVTVAPLVNAWGFGPPGRTASPPAEAELTRLRGLTGWSKLHLDQPGHTLRKDQPELTCDLSAIAKGYAVDRVAEALAAAGHVRYMVEAGGEVRTAGRNAAGEPWRIGIERPIETGRVVYRVLGLEGLAMATSGDYRNYRDLEGERVTHIMDPRTGRPIPHLLAAVSVIDPQCARADAWATALMVLGDKAGYEVAVREGLAALLLVHSPGGGVEPISTPRFQQLFPAAP